MTEAQYIISRMSPVELAMLQSRGVHLPSHLAAKAATHRKDKPRSESEIFIEANRTFLKLSDNQRSKIKTGRAA